MILGVNVFLVHVVEYLKKKKRKVLLFHESCVVNIHGLYLHCLHSSCLYEYSQRLLFI